MPEICRFYGIVVAIHFADHVPPHFHARYQRSTVSVDIHDLAILRGEIPARALGLVREWATLHRKELLEDWELASSGQPLRRIEPLR